MKSREEIIQRMFEVEIEMQHAKGTIRWGDLNNELRTLKWVLDYDCD